MNKSIVKSFLSFLWAMPFLYMFIDIYFTLDLRLSPTSFKVVIFLSFFSALALCAIWFKEFKEVSYLNRAFNYLRSNEIDKLEQILNKTPIDNYLEDGKTLLQYAVDNQMEPEIITYLLSKDGLAIYTYKDDYDVSYTLFYLSAYYNYLNEKMVIFLLKKGANVNFIDNTRGFDGLSVLQTMILRANKPLIGLLLEKGADVNYMVKDLSLNAIMLAARYIDDPIIIKMLIEAGSNIHDLNKDGYNALLFAAHYNPNPSIISVLVNHKAKIKPYTVRSALLKYNEVTPLMLAASYNNEEVVKKLINLDDDVDYRDNFELSVLFMAAANNPNVDVLKCLVAAGASIENSRDNEGNTPLMVASYLNSNPNVIRYLIDRTHNLHAKNKDGVDFKYYIAHNTNLSDDEKDVIINRWAK